MTREAWVGRLTAATLLLALAWPLLAVEPSDRGPLAVRGADDRARGWFWYDDPPPPRPEEPKPVAPAAKPAPTDKPGFVKDFEAFQERVRQSRMRFFMHPSPENASAMAEIQTAMVRRASDAADVWQRVIWTHPQFDFTQERPVNQLALAARDAARRETRAQLFDRLAESHVLYFLFRSDCPYCRALAPVLAAFSQATGLRVFPVSLDGAGVPEFPRPARDNGIARTLQVSTVPALFLADPGNARVAPIGYGMMSETELAERIEAIADPRSPELRAATPSQSLRTTEVPR